MAQLTLKTQTTPYEIEIILIKTEKCEFRKTGVSITGCHGNVNIGDHVIQKSKYSEKILRKSRQVWW